MTARRLAAVLLKVWGVLWLVSALTSLPQTLLLFLMTPMKGEQQAFQVYTRWSSVLSVALTLGGALVLLIGSDSIARRIAGADDEIEGASLAHLDTVAFGLVGVYFLIGAIRETVVALWAMHQHPTWDTTGQFAYMLENTQRELVGAVVQGVLAAVLLIGRGGWTRMWRKLHPMGDRASVDEAGE